MIRGLYISQNNMVVNTKRLEVISNNLANVESVGYKKDEYETTGFNEILISKFNGSNVKSEPDFDDSMEFSKTSDGYEASTNWGYFKIQTSNGISNNKTIRFDVDDEGYLSTYYLNSDRTKDWNYGDKIVGQNGFINVGDNEFELGADGSVIVSGEVVDKLVHNTPRGVIGTLSAGIISDRIFTNFTQGSLKMTGGTTDIALQGDGFFELETPHGQIYTRNGVFQIDNDGVLRTTEGYSVMGLNGPIQTEDGELYINELGEILQNGEAIDKIKTVKFSNKGDLNKIGGSFFIPKEEMQGEVLDFDGEVLQGYLESSNSSVISEMIKMISLSRNYESGQKIITAIDTEIGKAVNDVGRVG